MTIELGLLLLEALLLVATVVLVAYNIYEGKYPTATRFWSSVTARIQGRIRTGTT